MLGRTFCTLPTHSCLPVPRSVVPVGTSNNILWTGALRLSGGLRAPPHREGVNVHLGGGTACRRSPLGMHAVIPSDGSAENPSGLSPPVPSVRPYRHKPL